MRVGRSAIGLCATGSQIAAAARRVPRAAPAPGGLAPRPLPCGAVLDLRLYRVTLLPFAVGLIVVAFSLHAGPAALSGSQPGAIFNAHRAYGAMIALGSTGGDPAPGSATDDAIARAIAAHQPPNGFAHANFQSIRIVRTSARTTSGTRTISTVIATRDGAAPGIALIADRAG